MAGQTGKFTRRLEAEMREAAEAEEFERAARLRDDLQALQRALEKQAVVLPDGTDCDVIGLVEDSLEAAVQVFYVRGGRVRGQRGWVVDKVEDVSTAELVEHFLGQVYRDDPAAEQHERPARPTAGAARPSGDTPDGAADVQPTPQPTPIRPARIAAAATPAGPVPTGSPRLTARPCRGKFSCRSCRRMPPPSPSGSPPAAAPGSASGCRSAGTSARCSRR